MGTADSHIHKGSWDHWVSYPTGSICLTCGISELCSDVWNTVDAYRRVLDTHILLIAELLLLWLAYDAVFQGPTVTILPPGLLGPHPGTSVSWGGRLFYHQNLVTGLTVNKCLLNKSMLYRLLSDPDDPLWPPARQEWDRKQHDKDHRFLQKFQNSLGRWWANVEPFPRGKKKKVNLGQRFSRCGLWAAEASAEGLLEMSISSPTQTSGIRNSGVGPSKTRF